MATRKPKGLGRGLDALLGVDVDVIDSIGSAEEQNTTPQELSVDVLVAGKYQPRTRMDEGGLNELADSIRTQGIMQPILVRPLAKEKNKQKYEIIAGERRFRAAQIAGLTQVPVLVREVADENAAVMALIENIQREDLNPLEEAHGVKRLIDEFGLTHEQAAQAIGQSRSATTNLLRLINLAEPVQIMLLADDIDMGHARALLGTDAATQIMLANEVIARRLSVRETERLVAKTLREADNTADNEVAETTKKNGDVQRVEKILSEHLGTQVVLKVGAKDKGHLQISFHGWEHLNSLLERQGWDALINK